MANDHDILDGFTCVARRHMDAEFRVYDAMLAICKAAAQKLKAEGKWKDGDPLPTCYARTTTLCNMINRTRRPVFDLLQKLEATGWIVDTNPERQRRRNGTFSSNEYRIVEHADFLIAHPHSCPPLLYGYEEESLSTCGEQPVDTMCGEQPVDTTCGEQPVGHVLLSATATCGEQPTSMRGLSLRKNKPDTNLQPASPENENRRAGGQGDGPSESSLEKATTTATPKSRWLKFRKDAGESLPEEMYLMNPTAEERDAVLAQLDQVNSNAVALAEEIADWVGERKPPISGLDYGRWKCWLEDSEYRIPKLKAYLATPLGQKTYPPKLVHPARAVLLKTFSEAQVDELLANAQEEYERRQAEKITEAKSK